MQQDPIESQPKNLALPEEKRVNSSNSSPSEHLRTQESKGHDETANDEEHSDDADGDFDSMQSTMRGRYYREEDQATFLDWLNTNLPLELEIGSGKGLFLTNAAKRTPSHRFVGLEIAAKYALECQSRIEKIGLPNAKFFACDAVAVLDQDVADSTLDAVHVYFPDPWWKSRHKKRRVLNEKSLRNIQRALKPSGSLHFWTDVLDYYEGTLELIDLVTDLKGPFFVSEPPAEHDMDYLTHFERRTRRNGLPVYRSRFVKA